MQDSNIQKRFTPASAGNIRCLTLCQTLHWVHPRIRGEYSDGVTYRTYVMGSPPHPRGILRIVGRYGRRIGFTPASAGNIPSFFIRWCKWWVHPRIRGEYAFSASIPISISGSPPHPRGISGVGKKEGVKGRFTPASAGNIRFHCNSFLQYQVHPRIRGEYCGP